MNNRNLSGVVRGWKGQGRMGKVRVERDEARETEGAPPWKALATNITWLVLCVRWKAIEQTSEVI